MPVLEHVLLYNLTEELPEGDYICALDQADLVREGKDVTILTYSRMRHQTGLGWGDVKLIAAIGAWIGWQFVPWFILLASMSALTYGIFQIIKHGKHMANERIPFGPFLCGSSWLVWLYAIS